METATGFSEENLRALAEEEAVSHEDVAVAVDALLGETRFVIDTEGRAEWALNKLLGWDAEIARVNAQHAIRIKNLRALRAGFWGRFHLDLADWLRAALKKQGGKKRSVDLFAGRLGFTKKPGGLRFIKTREQETLEWAKAQDLDLTRQPERPPQPPAVLDKEAMKKLYGSTGEIPPGCEVVDDTDDLSVKPPKG